MGVADHTARDFVRPITWVFETTPIKAADSAVRRVADEPITIDAATGGNETLYAKAIGTFFAVEPGPDAARHFAPVTDTFRRHAAKPASTVWNVTTLFKTLRIFAIDLPVEVVVEEIVASLGARDFVTGGAVSVEDKTVITGTREAADIVGTGLVAAAIGDGALVDVITGDAISVDDETVIAGTREAADSVGTGLVAAAIGDGALVEIGAALTVTHVARSTGAAESISGVGAICVGVTSLSAGFALICRGRVHRRIAVRGACVEDTPIRRSDAAVG